MATVMAAVPGGRRFSLLQPVVRCPYQFAGFAKTVLHDTRR
ncbi:hypothetical protein MHOL44478_17065 [Mycobacterium holsaticum DSM 44478]|nr:hypothetical protein [Mycolicibacterium holsaticum DSM 44478 = JCM 12374]